MLFPWTVAAVQNNMVGVPDFSVCITNTDLASLREFIDERFDLLLFQTYDKNFF